MSADLLDAILSASWSDGGKDGLPSSRTAVFIVDAILVSDWLKEHDAQVRAATIEAAS